MSFIIADPSWF